MVKTKALIYMNPGNPVFIDEDIESPGQNQVGIEIITSSLCNTSELRSFKGDYTEGYGVNYPMKTGEPGHEAAGRIVELGAGSKGFALGDYVVVTGHGGNPCHRSRVNRKCDDIAAVHPKNRDISEAAVLEMYGCAYHCALTPISPEGYAGKRVLVIGMGSMGLCTVQILKNLNTTELVAMDLSTERLALAEKSGADRMVRPDEVENTEKFDVIIECSGSVSGQETACAMAPKVLIFSSYNTKGIAIKQNLWFDAQTSIYNPGIVTSENFKKVAELYNKEMIDPSILISKRISPNEKEYLETIDEIKAGKLVKVLMEWNN